MTPEARQRMIAGLKSWKPGQSGNPNGRPKTIISDAYRRWAKKTIPKTLREAIIKQGIPLPLRATFADALAIGMLGRGVRGDSNCAREVREAIEGRAPQRIELTGKEGEPIQVEAAVNRIRELYGLRARIIEATVVASEDRAADDSVPAETLSLPESLD